MEPDAGGSAIQRARPGDDGYGECGGDGGVRGANRVAGAGTCGGFDRAAEGLGAHDAYWTVTHSSPEDLELVVIGGRPLYGNVDLMEMFGGAGKLRVCDASKEVAVGGKTFAETLHTLEGAMHLAGRVLAPLAECGY